MGKEASDFSLLFFAGEVVVVSKCAAESFVAVGESSGVNQIRKTDFGILRVRSYVFDVMAMCVWRMRSDKRLFWALKRIFSARGPFTEEERVRETG